jgi:hypothetical protein
MCSTCEQAAAAVVEAGASEGLDAEAVRRVVRAFNDAGDHLLAPEAFGPEQEQTEAAPGEDEFLDAMIGAGLVSVVEMYPLGRLPFVLIEAEEIGEAADPAKVAVAVSARAGGGMTKDAASAILRTALAQVEAE